MRKAMLSFGLFVLLLPGAAWAGGGERLANLRTPEELRDVIFGWDSLPGWLITDVVFGIKDGELAFARYTATPPGGFPVMHDRTREVDWVIEDTMNFPGTFRLSTATGDFVEVRRFTIGVRPDGKGVIDSLEGRDSAGRPISMQAGDALEKNGVCGAPVVLGRCSGALCFGSCVPDFADSDPCDCTGNGFCTDGTAIIACPVGTCPGICVFTLGLCGCFPNVVATRCTIQPVSSSVVNLTVQNVQGIADIRVTNDTNVTVAIPPFAAGTTAPVVVTATKQNPALSARIEIAVIDVFGGITPCDPILTLAVRSTGKPVKETFSDIPQAESKVKVMNGSSGIKRLDVIVNGVRFRLSGLRDGEERSLDVSAAMAPGNGNVIALSATGKPGGSATVMIHD
jgi:hypothetical protein